jgi:hypothetical protein
MNRRGTRFQVFFVTAVFNLAAPVIANAQSSNSVAPAKVEIVSSHKRVMFDGSTMGRGIRIPYWQKGYLVSSKTEVWSADEWAVELYDSRGVQVREAKIWFPNSTRVGINGAAVTPDGRIVIAGNANQSDGTRAFFIAVTGDDGKFAQVIRTNPYLAAHVCVAPDGSIWAFGDDVDSGRDSQSPTLRHFDIAKGQVAALLPRSTFSTRHSPAAPLGEGRSVAFACSQDRVVVYPEAAGEFIEVDFATQTVHRWKLDRSYNDLPLYGSYLAITTSGDVCGKLGPISNVTAPRGLFCLERLGDTGQARWLPVEGHQYDSWDTSIIGWVYGADGDALVYSKKGDRPAVEWARLQRMQ